MSFLSVYIREAHPAEQGRYESNDREKISIKQPTTLEERADVAKLCCSSLKMTMPLVVDGVDDRVTNAYSAMPDRLYLIDEAGKVVYRGGRGPSGFKPGELEQVIVMMLLDRGTQTPIAPMRRR